MKDIDKIIEKYFDGETSLSEEKMLRNYFMQAHIEERHKVYVPMFNFFSEERQEASPQKVKKKHPLYTWAAIAASIVLIAVIKFTYTPAESVPSQSLVYINGKEISDISTINDQALISIKNVSEVDEDVLNSQIGVLNSFTE